MFSGGWTLEAAEAVCAPDLEFAVLDGLGTLVDQSLVRRIDDMADGARYAMLETIREYATERLSRSDEHDAVRRRHADYFLALAEQTAFMSQHDTGSIERTDVERDNLRAVLAWAVARGEAETGLRVAAAVWPLWPGRDLTEGRAWLERLLALPQSRGRDAARARALTTLGSIEIWQNDSNTARTCLEEAAEIARGLGDASLLAHALITLEVLVRAGGDLERSVVLLQEGLTGAENAGDRALAADFRGRLGFVEVFRGDPAAAMGPLRETIAIQREMGQPHSSL